MLQLGADARFSLEPGDRSWIIHSLRGEDLQRHPAVEAGIPGEKDTPHPSLTDQLEEHVTVDFVPGAAPCQQLLRLPLCEQVRMHRLTRQPAVKMLRLRLFGWRNCIPASGETLFVQETAPEGRLPESGGLWIEHGAT